MLPIAQRWLIVAAVTGALAVVLGAFGAHAVPSYLQSRGFDAEAIADRSDDFHIAARYHTYGALFLVGVAIVLDRQTNRALVVAAWCMLLGIVVFSGAVYAVALVPIEARSTFGMMAPIGGSLMIAAWVALAIGAVSKRE